ncbi:MAG: DUF4173 domain-containing protein [Chloroflexi bacterium]|nr:DUF4173 domain-containing protein [Chloroflexota bacterium]
MDPRLARRVALAALLLGILGDLLFDRVALGINVPIAIGAGLVAATLFRPAGSRIDRLDLWIPLVAMLAALGVALRADPTIVAFDLALAGVATLAWMICCSGVALTRRSVDVVVAAGAWAGAWLGIGGVVVAGRAGSDGALGKALGSSRGALPIIRGVALATPVVLVLAALLASADAVFGKLIGNLLKLPFDLSDLAVRSVVVLAIAWLAAGALSIAAGGLPYRPESPARSLGAAARSRTGWLVLPGATEALVVLVAVDALFGAFVAVQVAYLFGGLGTVLGTGITFSDYAREGYFQLIAVVAFAGVLLAFAEAAAHRTRTFLVAALGLVGLTFVILASAAVRLALYLQAYGWTELRFYVAASMAWLAIGGLLLGILIARDRVRWLAHGLALGAVIVTLGVTAIGPQSFITDQNVARVLDPARVPASGHAGLDTEYLSELGDDAIPSLVDAWPRVDAATRAVLQPVLLSRWYQLRDDPTTTSWPSWNLARERARSALEALFRP